VDVNGDLIPAFQFSQHDARLAGAEFLIDLHPHPLDWLHWENTLSFVRGKFTSAIEGDKDIPSIPPTRWISEFRTELFPKGNKIRNLVIHLEADHSFNQNHPFTAYGTETKTPGYTLINAGISGNVISKNRTLFSIYINAMNLGDVAYQTHLSRLKYTDPNPLTGRIGVFNMGRNFSFKVNVPFAF
jgi:iron complex outermembrane receptor protein